MLFVLAKQHFPTNKSTIHFHVLQGMHILQALQSLMNIHVQYTNSWSIHKTDSLRKEYVYASLS